MKWPAIIVIGAVVALLLFFKSWGAHAEINGAARRADEPLSTTSAAISPAAPRPTAT